MDVLMKPHLNEKLYLANYYSVSFSWILVVP